MKTAMLAPVLLGMGLAARAADNKDTFTRAGDVFQYGVPMLAVGTARLKGDDEGLKQYLKSAGITAALTHLGKEGLNDPRPNGANDKGMPSGHTSGACAAAAFLRNRYDDLRLIGPAYGACVLTAASRVHAKAHSVKQVLAGWALAEVVSAAVVDKWQPGLKQRQYRYDPASFAFVPTIDQKGKPEFWFVYKREF